MSLRVKCPGCQATCVVAESSAGRNVRCPRCQNVFQPDEPPAVEAITDAEPAAPPPRPRGNDLIPPPRKRPKDELIPPPPGGDSVKKLPGFVEREARDLVFLLIVGVITTVVMAGLITAVVVGVSLFRASSPGQAPPKPVELNAAAGQGPAGAPAPRDHGPPPFEEWKVLAEHRLEQKGGVWHGAVSPDGRLLATTSDAFLRLWDLSADPPVFGVKQLFFTPDGRRLILGTGAGAVRLWDVAGPQPRQLAARDGESDTFLLPMALSPDGSTLAVARGKTVHLLDVVGDGFAEWMKLDRHPKALRAVNFSPDGRLLATTGTDGQILVWKTGLDRPVLVKQRAGTFGEVLFVPGADVRVAACMWSAPGTIYLFKVGK